MSINRGMFDRWMDKEDVVYIQWNITIYKKEWNLSICDNMDKSRGHYAKWDKSDRDRQHIITLTWNLKKKKMELIDTENRWLPEAESGGVYKMGEGAQKV